MTHSRPKRQIAPVLYRLGIHEAPRNAPRSNVPSAGTTQRGRARGTSRHHHRRATSRARSAFVAATTGFRHRILESPSASCVLVPTPRHHSSPSGPQRNSESRVRCSSTRPPDGRDTFPQPTRGYFALDLVQQCQFLVVPRARELHELAQRLIGDGPSVRVGRSFVNARQLPRYALKNARSAPNTKIRQQPGAPRRRRMSKGGAEASCPSDAGRQVVRRSCASSRFSSADGGADGNGPRTREPGLTPVVSARRKTPAAGHGRRARPVRLTVTLVAPPPDPAVLGVGPPMVPERSRRARSPSGSAPATARQSANSSIEKHTVVSYHYLQHFGC